MHLQFKHWRHYLARSTLWYRTMQNGFYRVSQRHRWHLKRSRWSSPPHPEFGAVGTNPSHPIPGAFHSMLLTRDREHHPLHCEPVLCWCQADFMSLPDIFERWLLRCARAWEGRWPAEVSWETDDELGAARKGIWQQRRLLTHTLKQVYAARHCANQAEK